MTWATISDEFTIDDVGARLLSNLARGIYSHEAVLREYVQNACDAYHDLPSVPDHATIRITIEDPSSIAIQDNGLGMDLQGVRDAKKIAVSPKAGQDRTGFRGIGIWAGFQACDMLEIDTTKLGVAKRYRLQINFAEILKHVDADINIKALLDGRFQIDEDAADPQDHYTRVRLVGLHGDYKKLASRDELNRIVSQTLPCKVDPQFKYATEIGSILSRVDHCQEFSILVEGGEVFKSFPSDVTAPVEIILKRDGEEYGRAWYCTGQRSLSTSGFEYRNFRLRIRNFGVGRVGLYDDEDGTGFGIVNQAKLASRAHLNWHVGEIHITNPDIKPDTPRSSLELDALSRRAIEAVRSFYDDRIADSRAFSEFKARRDQVAEAGQLVTAGEVQTASDKYLTHLQEQEALVRGRRPAQKVKSKLRDLLNEPTLKKERQRLIKLLSPIAAPGTHPDPTTPPPSDPQPTPPGAAPQDPAGAPSASPHSPPAVTSEQLLSDVIAAVEEKLGDDKELAEEVTAAIVEVFRLHGLVTE